MRHWLGVVTRERFATERLHARDAVAVPPGAGPAAAEAGDLVVLVAAERRPVLFGHGVVSGSDDAGVRVEYRERLVDEPSPLPAGALPAAATPGLHPLPPARYRRLAGLVDASAPPRPGRTAWFVSLALPIEAATPAEAVREFWTYAEKLGPRELPVYVWPLGDELAMQAFVHGGVTNLDPEEDDGGS